MSRWHRNLMAFAIGFALSLAGFSAMAADDTEIIAVLNMQLDGSVKVQKVRLPRIAGVLHIVCIREFDASAISCYSLSPDHGEEALRFDLDLK